MTAETGARWIAVPAANLLAIWGSSDSNVFAVGTGGTILHYNGSDWQLMNSGTTTEFVDIWGISGSDVFAVGGSTMLHYDGSSWSQVDTGVNGYFTGVWTCSTSDVYASASHSILHYDGNTWSHLTPSPGGPSLRCIWGSSPSNVFATGEYAVFRNFDGNTWETIASSDPNDPALKDISCVWGSSDLDIFAVGCLKLDTGHPGRILHYDGNAWSTVNLGTIPILYGVWGSSFSDVFAVGSSGTILHYSASTEN